MQVDHEAAPKSVDTTYRGELSSTPNLNTFDVVLGDDFLRMITRDFNLELVVMNHQISSMMKGGATRIDHTVRSCKIRNATRLQSEAKRSSKGGDTGIRKYIHKVPACASQHTTLLSFLILFLVTRYPNPMAPISLFSRNRARVNIGR